MAASASGSIKSFNATKGFGFITCDQVDGDLYFKGSSLPEELKDGCFDDSFIELAGKSVYFSLHSTPDGKHHAKDVTLVRTSEQEPLVGTVKSFSDKAGYGFIACSSVEGDVFFKLKYTPDHMQSGGVKGQAVRFCVHVTEDGKPQANKLVFKSAPMALKGGAKGMSKGMTMMPIGGADMGSMGTGCAPMGKGAIGSGYMDGYGKSSGMKGKYDVGMDKGYGGKGDWGKGVQYDPYGKGAQYDPYGKGAQYDPWGKGGKDDPWGKGAQYGGKPDWGKGADMGKGGKPGLGKGGKGPQGKGAADDGVSTGVVKSFNAAKGFGFIQSRDFPADIYFKFEGGEIAAGSPVSFKLRVTADGKAQGLNVQQGLGEGEQVIGTVKSINAKKGFGFLEVPGQAGDAYFKVDDLPSELLSLDEAMIVGQQVHFNVHLTPDGKMQMRGATSTGQSVSIGGTKRAASAMQAHHSGKPQLHKQARHSGGMSCIVKSYNPAKGWGFLSCPEVGADIYFQRKLLGQAFPGQELVGMSGAVEVAFTPDGKPQAVSLQLA